MGNKIVACRYIPHTLFFYRPAGTSRGLLYEKLSYFLEATDDCGRKYHGECGLLKGLSIDDRPGYEDKLEETCRAVENDSATSIDLTLWPSIKCGLEMLIHEIHFQETGKIFDNDFYSNGKSIPINGLIWMGEPSFMLEQVRTKIEAGFRCIKMKVGAIDWEQEKQILTELRAAGTSSLTIRVDANGAWAWNDSTKEKMEFLHSIGVHSIEQPIAVGKHAEMQQLSEWSPIPIALDEELFHYHTQIDRAELLDKLQVEYIVLKPSLVGGFTACDGWIKLCKERNMSYWMTSALESNVALNAISQYTFPHANTFFQGLGTGSLYENNIASPLTIEGDSILYDADKRWDFSPFSERFSL